MVGARFLGREITLPALSLSSTLAFRMLAIRNWM